MAVRRYDIHNIGYRIYKKIEKFSAAEGKWTGIYLMDWQRKLKRYRNIYKDETAFLIGNGPSVRTEDLERLKGRITFCCNKFYMSYAYHTFRPTYTVSADDKMIEDFGDEIVKNSSGIVWFCSTFPVVQKEKDFHWVFIQSERLRMEEGALPAGVYHTGATLLAALQIGYYMGIRKFVLYGVDHNFKYESKDLKSSTTEGNHFIENYREGKPWFVPDTFRIENSFKEIAGILEGQGGYLVNASRKTRLPYIERILLDDTLR